MPMPTSLIWSILMTVLAVAPAGKTLINHLNKIEGGAALTNRLGGRNKPIGRVKFASDSKHIWPLHTPAYTG